MADQIDIDAEREWWALVKGQEGIWGEDQDEACERHEALLTAHAAALEESEAYRGTAIALQRRIGELERLVEAAPAYERDMTNEIARLRAEVERLRTAAMKVRAKATQYLNGPIPAEECHAAMAMILRHLEETP